MRAFTAIGRIAEREPYETEMGGGHIGWRRDIAYERQASEAGVYPLLDRLSFIKDREHWGLFFHGSLSAVPRSDFAMIAAAMGLDQKRL